MVKKRTTAEALSEGMKRVGGLSSFAKTGARRDSPFSFVEPEPVQAKEETPPAEVTPKVVTPAAREEPIKKPTPPKQAPKVERPKAAVSPKEKAPPKPKARAVPVSKNERFPERVTIPISEEMRDDLGLLASRLQRQRTEKNERITPNTLVRSAVRLMLEELKVTKHDVANNEEEVFLLLKQKVGLS